MVLGAEVAGFGVGLVCSPPGDGGFGVGKCGDFGRRMERVFLCSQFCLMENLDNLIE